MQERWQPSRFLFFFSLALCAYASAQTFENSAIVRTVDLGGSLVHVTTTYAIRALQNNVKKYTIALGKDEHSKTSWFDVKVKGQNAPLEVKERHSTSEQAYRLLDVTLPNQLGVDKTLNLVFESIQSHATWPWPATAAQNEEQLLKYATDLFVLSPYATVVQRTKLKSMTPRIVSYDEPKGISGFVEEAPVTKSGATATYGPYKDIPPSANEQFIEKYQQPVTIHYHYDQPLLEVLKLNRAVEISHWGANLNTQDEIVLQNAGPKLKGHFSRLDFQTQVFYKRPAPHMIPGITLHLPSGISNTYFYDLIGNVSTSRLRVAPSVPKERQGTQFSILELKPRFPLFGGWNYTFTLGWDSPLQDSASYDKSTGKYIVEVPIMTPIMGSVVDEEQLNIILPEGATDIDFALPFPAISNSIGTHTTYLDTTGRPILTFHYKNLTPKHAESIFVSYKVSTSAHLKKPIAVSAAFFTLFVLGFLAKRVNLSLHEKKKSS